MERCILLVLFLARSAFAFRPRDGEYKEDLKNKSISSLDLHLVFFCLFFSLCNWILFFLSSRLQNLQTVSPLRRSFLYGVFWFPNIDNLFCFGFLLDADPNLFQGDMRLSFMQRLLAMSGGDVSLAGNSNNAFGSAKDQSMLWLPSKQVPYEISPDLGEWWDQCSSAIVMI